MDVARTQALGAPDPDRALRRAAGPTVFLHIGTMHSGSSYVQQCLAGAASALGEDGTHVLGPIGAAVHDLLDRPPNKALGDTHGAWDAMAAEIREGGNVQTIASMEFLVLADHEQAERAVDSLRPAVVDVVITARDLGRALPSAWQQTTRTRQTATWPAYVSAVMAATQDPDQHHPFWRHHNLARIVRTWSEAAGAGRVTIVTVPPPGADPRVLWHRFCDAVGLPPGRYPAISAQASNRSLGFDGAELLRRINVSLPADFDVARYRSLVGRFLGRRVLSGSESGTLTLPPDAAIWVSEQSQATLKELEQLGVRVVGSLSDLVPSPALDEHGEVSSSQSLEPAAQVAHDDQVPPEADVTAAAVHAAAALVRRIVNEEPSAPEGRGPGRGRRKRVAQREVAAKSGSVPDTASPREKA